MAFPAELSWAHPVTAEWFERKFGTPTEPQMFGWPSILAGKPTLISAPTGSGKTLAAFLVCIDRLLRQSRWAPGVVTGAVGGAGVRGKSPLAERVSHWPDAAAAAHRAIRYAESHRAGGQLLDGSGSAARGGDDCAGGPAACDGSGHRS